MNPMNHFSVLSKVEKINFQLEKIFHIDFFVSLSFHQLLKFRAVFRRELTND